MNVMVNGVKLYIYTLSSHLKGEYKQECAFSKAKPTIKAIGFSKILQLHIIIRYQIVM
jgi:hypothetical protein